MDMGMGWKIAIVAMLGFFLWRLWPTTKDWLENGPKGSSEDWMTFALLIAGVVGFVLLLMWLV